MGTISGTVQQHMERFRQKQMELEELTPPGWEEAVKLFCEQDKKYGTAKLSGPVVIQPQTDDNASAPPPTTFGEDVERLDIVPGISQMPQGTSRPGSSHILLGLVKLQSNMSISDLLPAAEADMSPLLNGQPVEAVIFYPCI